MSWLRLTLGPGRLALVREWEDAHLALLPKPTKAPTSPGALRPISPLHPVSKALGVILARRLQPSRHVLSLHVSLADPPTAPWARAHNSDVCRSKFAHAEVCWAPCVNRVEVRGSCQRSVAMTADTGSKMTRPAGLPSLEGFAVWPQRFRPETFYNTKVRMFILGKKVIVPLENAHRLLWVRFKRVGYDSSLRGCRVVDVLQRRRASSVKALFWLGPNVDDWV